MMQCCYDAGLLITWENYNSSPGLYIYVVTEDETGLEFVGKFAVVR